MWAILTECWMPKLRFIDETGINVSIERTRLDCWALITIHVFWDDENDILKKKKIRCQCVPKRLRIKMTISIWISNELETWPIFFFFDMLNIGRSNSSDWDFMSYVLTWHTSFITLHLNRLYLSRPFLQSNDLNTSLKWSFSIVIFDLSKIPVSLPHL